MNRGAVIAGLAGLVGCGRIGFGVAPDACVTTRWYADTDGDGHGDAASPTDACEQPPVTVAIADDCDDGNAERSPGLVESCDALDNDCNTATVEVCPAGCTPLRRPPPDAAHIYLACFATTSWDTARTACEAAGFRLVEINTASENAWLSDTGIAIFGNGTQFHIGGSDAVTEGEWIWDGSEQFWTGGLGGAPVAGRFAAWIGSEPNDMNGNEDCLEMGFSGLGMWNDIDCVATQRQFVCRR